MGLNRDGILGAVDIIYDEFEVPEWGGTVRIKSMNGEEREIFETVYISDSEKQIRATAAALSLVDDNDERLFTADEVEDLGKKSYKALERIFERVRIINKMSETAEETEKN